MIPAEPQTAERGGKPSLIVLPFVNLSGDPSKDYFADGIVEDLITALSRFKSFAVIARNSSFVYKNWAVDARQIADDLDVRFSSIAYSENWVDIARGKRSS